MEDLPAVEPVKIYENTYRLPEEASRCAAGPPGETQRTSMADFAYGGHGKTTHDFM